MGVSQGNESEGGMFVNRGFLVPLDAGLFLAGVGQGGREMVVRVVVDVWFG